MSLSVKFYKESLYPFQDGILKIARDIGAPFYLTGGTAISRCYASVRFSDDLDLFVNSHPDFGYWVESLFNAILSASKEKAFNILTERVIRQSDFTQIFLEKKMNDRSIHLKIYLVNDVAPHYGEFIQHHVLGAVDSIQNILSHKITALFRMEPKDVVDIWTLCRIFRFSWRQIFQEANSKEAGIDPPAVYELLMSFPVSELSGIIWSDKPDFEHIISCIRIIARDILEGKDNSLS